MKPTISKTITKSARPNKEREEKKALMFLEELSWLLDRYESLNFKSAVKNLMSEKSPERNISNESKNLSRLSPSKNNKAYIVGVLPGTLINDTLFPSNEDIASFALSALDVAIPNWEKKSKVELIGHIVCNIAIADDSQFNRAVTALEYMTSHSQEAKRLISSGRKKRMAWNEIIQKMLEETR